MLLQSNSYIVPKEKRTEHMRLVKRFKQIMARLGCDEFEVFEQTGVNWTSDAGGRFVQILRFRDQDHAEIVRKAEQSDPDAQQLIAEFCQLVNFAYQHQQGLATTSFYSSVAAGKSSRNIGPIVPSADSADHATVIATSPATKADQSPVNPSPLGLDDVTADDDAELDGEHEIIDADSVDDVADLMDTDDEMQPKR